MSGLEGRRILVVGGSSGIGEATGRMAAEEGAIVAFAARRQERLEEIVAGTPRAIAVPCDVTDPASCDAAVAAVVESLGGLDAVVYTTGIFPMGLLTEADDAFWQRVFSTNVFGASRIARAAAPHLRASGGRLVFVSSNAAERPWPGMVIYAASKAALECFVAGWRNEEPEIAATTVVVGPTLTDALLEGDAELGARLRPRWAAGGYLPENPQIQQPVDVATEICNVLRSNTRVTDVRVVPPGT